LHLVEVGSTGYLRAALITSVPYPRLLKSPGLDGVALEILLPDIAKPLLQSSSSQLVILGHARIAKETCGDQNHEANHYEHDWTREPNWDVAHGGPPGGEWMAAFWIGDSGRINSKLASGGYLSKRKGAPYCTVTRLGYQYPDTKFLEMPNTDANRVF